MCIPTPKTPAAAVTQVPSLASASGILLGGASPLGLLGKSLLREKTPATKTAKATTPLDTSESPSASAALGFNAKQPKTYPNDGLILPSGGV